MLVLCSSSNDAFGHNKQKLRKLGGAKHIHSLFLFKSLVNSLILLFLQALA